MKKIICISVLSVFAFTSVFGADNETTRYYTKVGPLWYVAIGSLRIPDDEDESVVNDCRVCAPQTVEDDYHCVLDCDPANPPVWPVDNNSGYDASHIEIPAISWRVDRKEKHRFWKMKAYVRRIENGVFKNRENLVSINMPLINNIDAEAFSGCKNLKTVYAPWVSEISTEAFSGCKNLETVDAPRVHIIGDAAFKDCGKLSQVKNYSRKICAMSFNNCFNLTTVKLSDCTEIGDGAFSGCVALKTFNAPSLVSIGANAFSGCEKLPSYQIPKTVTSIGAGAFSGCISFETIILPHISKIEQFSFSSCVNLRHIEIPYTVLEIEDGAFSGCQRLHAVTIPPFLEKFGMNCFSGSAITEITIPKTVTTIKPFAFQGCSLLGEVINENPIPQNIDRSVFSGITLEHLTLIVPPGSVQAYRNAPIWKEFGAIKARPVGIALDWFRLNLVVGVTHRLFTEVLPEGVVTNEVYWDSSDWSIAEVDGEGIITACSPGTAVITATLPLSRELCFIDSCVVIVVPNPNLRSSTIAIPEIETHVNHPFINLTVSSDTPELVSVHTLSGALIHTFTTSSIPAQVYLPSASTEVLVVSGSSGWSKKIVVSH
jgi:hypothetical protein